MIPHATLSAVLRPLPAEGAGTAGTSRRKPTAAETAQEFESVLLGSFIQAMLPKHVENVLGRGLAGEIWKSMLSEKLGAELARRGDFGIAELVREAGDAARPAGTGRTVIQAQEPGSRVLSVASDHSFVPTSDWTHATTVERS